VIKYSQEKEIEIPKEIMPNHVVVSKYSVDVTMSFLT
jgi:hypothetical protein